jgi:NAD(P)-dependent dehydrogenase (short-subunit alcohol dehydrogenase family)
VKRTYLITAATGIGAATALLLAQREQANVFFCSLSAEPCEPHQQSLQALDAAAEFRVGDLTDPAFAVDLVAACAERFGRLDAVFNVAGISGRSFGDGPIERCTEEGWGTTIDTNLTTQYRVCREAVRAMQQQHLVNGQRGTLLNMSSILALHPEPKKFDTVAYAASKGAIIALTRTIAASGLAHAIRANAIAPALVRTAMSARASGNAEVLALIREKQPLTQEVIAVEDVAEACAFLLTDASRAITGQCLEVDAGWGLN